MSGRIWTLGVMCSLALAGCSERPSTLEQKADPGRAFGSIDVSRVQLLTISKDDAGNSDTWIARLENRGGEWRFVSGPHGEVLTDDRADGRWIAHFLDTLKTLQAEGKAPNGTLRSYGLDRPVFRVRWKAAQQEQELRMGSVDGPFGTVFAQLEPGEDAPVLLLRGAAIRMLTQLDRFDAVRDRKLLTFELDDADEILIEWGKQQRYFQRQGEFWADRHNVRFRGAALEKVTSTLEALSHLRIERFPDLASPAPPARLARTERVVTSQAAPVRAASYSPSLKVRFRMRTEKEQVLTLTPHSGRLTAELSTRPGNRFGLHQDAMRWVKALRQLPSQAAK